MALAVLHSSAAGARSGDRRGLDHRVFNSRIGRDRAEKDILPAGAGWLSWLRRSRSAGAIRARPERSDLLSLPAFDPRLPLSRLLTARNLRPLKGWVHLDMTFDDVALVILRINA